MKAERITGRLARAAGNADACGDRDREDNAERAMATTGGIGESKRRIALIVCDCDFQSGENNGIQCCFHLVMKMSHL